MRAFEYLARHGVVVIAVPSRLERASLQVSRPNVVVEARDSSSLGDLASARQAIERKIATLRSRSSSPGPGRPGP